MAKGRPRDAAISAKVERARELIAGDDKRTFASVAREVGMHADTLRYRLGRAAAPGDGDPAAPDALTQQPRSGEITVVERDYSHLSALRVYPMGDFHIGSPEHQDEVLDEWLGYLAASPSASLLFTGDGLNSALRTSVSDVYAEELTVGQAKRRLAKQLEPLRGRIDAMIRGNHEERIYKAVGDCPIEDIADRLEAPYSPASVLVRYLVGDQTYDLYLRHGAGGGGTVGAQVNRLEKQAGIIDADIYVSGHTHTQVAFPRDVFVMEGDKPVRKKRLFVCSGSFLSYEDYAATAGLPPAHIGAPRIYLDGERKDAHASV